MKTLSVLRGGGCSWDPRLDRVKEVDIRSLAYPVGAVLDAEYYHKPRSYTWRVDKILNQGFEGACVGFGFTYELGARPAIVKNLNDDYARSLYHEIQRNDEWEGGSYPGAIPVYEGTSVLAGAKEVTRRGYYSEYRWALNIQDFIAAIGYKGPIVIGVDWYTGMFDTDSQGFIKPTGQIEGGHCVMVAGQKIINGEDKRPDLVRSFCFGPNSWGPAWGWGGWWKMYYIDFLKLFPGGDFCVPIGRTAEPQPE